MLLHTAHLNPHFQTHIIARSQACSQVLNCTLLSLLHYMLPSIDSNSLDCTPPACWTTLPSKLHCTLPSILPSMVQIMLLMILDCTLSAHLPVCPQVHSQAVLLSAGTRHRVGCSGQGVAGQGILGSETMSELYLWCAHRDRMS
jgi:hypothetical protein